MARILICGCIALLLGACTTAPSTPAIKSAPPPATLSIQGLTMPNPDGIITRYLVNYDHLPTPKAMAVAVTAQGEYVAGVAVNPNGLLPATTAALQACEDNRAIRAFAAPCELFRVDDRELELGIAFRQRMQMDDNQRPTLLWRINHGNATVYVGGTVHVLRPTMLPLPPAFDRAYAASDDLTVEVDALAMSPTQALAVTQKYGQLPNGQTLAQVLPASTVLALQRRAEQLGVPWTTLERLRPAQVAAQLMLAESATLGMETSAGIDLTYARRAHAERKAVHSLESIDAQLALLQTMPIEDGDAPHDAAQMQTMFAQMLSAWFGADVNDMRNMIQQINSAPGGTAFGDALLDQRNIGMANGVAALLRTATGTHLVLVGAGHMPGPKGVLALLRASGFDPIQLNRAGDPLTSTAQPAANTPLTSSANHLDLASHQDRTVTGGPQAPPAPMPAAR